MSMRSHLLFASCLVLFSLPVMAKPSADLCRKHFTPMIPGEKVLDCKYVGGDRKTNQLYGQKYLTDIGSCWDFDLVALQRCGCRLFMKSSVCCRKGSTTDCEWRVGDSREVDCKKYGEPAFGLSGTTEPEECRARRMEAMCRKNKNLVFHGVMVGPCTSAPLFECPQGDSAMHEFMGEKCGPTPEDCGCTLSEDCSEAEALACYKNWRDNPEAVKCWDSKVYKNNWLKHQCLEKLQQAKEPQ
jgi:hypothetical protein